MASQIVDFVLNLKGNLEGKSKSAGDGLDGMGSSATMAAASVAAVATATIAAGAALFSYTTHIEQLVDETNTLGAATGLANTTIAGLRAAAAASGKALSDVVPKDLSKKILDAANGIKKAKLAFGQLGVSATDSSGQLRNADEVFRDILDQLTKIENPTMRSALAMQVLGNQGKELLTAFEGSAGLDKFVAQAEKYGHDVGPEAVAATGRWQGANAALAASLTHVGASVAEVTGMMGGMTDFINGTASIVVFSFEVAAGVVGIYTASIARAWEAAKALVTLDFKSFAVDGVGAFLDLAGLAGGVFQLKGIIHDASLATIDFLEATSVIADVDPTAGLATSLGFDAAALIGGPAGDPLVITFPEKTKKAAKEALEIEPPEPPDWIAALLDAGALDLKLDFTGSEELLKEFAAAIDDIPTKMLGALGGLRQAEALANDPIGELVKMVPLFGKLAFAVGDLALNLDDKLEGIFDSIFALPEDLGDSIKRLLVEVVPGIIAGLPDFVFAIISSLPNAIFEGVLLGTVAIVDAIVGLVIDLPVAIVEGIGGLFAGIWTTIKEFFLSIFTLGGEGGIFQTFADSANDLFGKKGGGRSGAPGSGLDASDLANVSLQSFATGGFVDRTGLALVHEGERVVPASGAGSGTASAGFGGITIQSLTVQANDPREFIRELRTHLGSFGLGDSLEAF